VNKDLYNTGINENKVTVNSIKTIIILKNLLMIIISMICLNIFKYLIFNDTELLIVIFKHS